MSIINEALKKAQREPAPAAAPAAPIVHNLRLKTEFREDLLGKKARINWGPAFVILVLLLIVGPILAPIFSTPFKVATPTNPSPAPRELVSVGSVVPQTPLHSPAMHSQFAIEEMPAAPVFQGMRPELTLSGIVFSEKESYCLINGKVLRLGETISGAEVRQITSNQVVLNSGGENITLTTNA